VALTPPAACPGCGSTRLEPDGDVLDTWFSSALWPFSTMGWPDETKLLKTFYPTSVLVTGFDILFFWVARMMMMGCHFMGDVPFKDVYVHALVRDESGKKMSKSSGNVIDPMVIIAQYGTDALRFTLAAFAAQGRDIKLSEKRIEGYRNFVNKLWNAARLTLMHVTEPPAPVGAETLSLADRWVLSRLRTTSINTASAIDDYRFNEGANEVYQFVWHEFCDWYLEAAKPALYGKWGKMSTQAALWVSHRVLHDILILLHPFIPFVTEEIWHLLPGTNDSIMGAVHPLDAEELESVPSDSEAEADMALIMDLITAVRNIRGEMNISPSRELSVVVETDESRMQKLVEDNRSLITSLARLSGLTASMGGGKQEKTATAIVAGMTIFVHLEGIIDFFQEAKRLEKALAKLDKEIQGLCKKLDNESFRAKAPAEVIEKVRQQHAEFSQKREKLKQNHDTIKAMAE
jgi:valyl-tRNA synthetase